MSLDSIANRLTSQARSSVRFADMSPRVILLVALAVLVLAVMETLTGQSLGGRFGRTAERANDPRNFWGIVTIHYVAGLLFLGYYLYRIL